MLNTNHDQDDEDDGYDDDHDAPARGAGHHAQYNIAIIMIMMIIDGESSRKDFLRVVYKLLVSMAHIQYVDFWTK